MLITHGTPFAQVTHQGAGVDPGDAHQSMALHPVLQGFPAAPAAGGRRQLTGDHPAGVGLIRFLIIGIHTGVAQFRIGKGHQLSGIGGIGEHLLVAGHAGVEHHFTDHRAATAEGFPDQNRSIGQNEMGLSG